jgi:hypothetical protein
MKNASIHDQLGQVEEMLAGLTSHVTELTKRGIDTAFITEMNGSYNKAANAHTEKLACKARMMEKTRECREFLGKTAEHYGVARKQVKIELPVETWREFGIVDKR